MAVVVRIEVKRNKTPLTAVDDVLSHIILGVEFLAKKAATVRLGDSFFDI
jgi:hypothetical protein